MRNEGSAKAMGCSDTTSGRAKVVAMVASNFPIGLGDCPFFFNIRGMMVCINLIEVFFAFLRS